MRAPALLPLLVAVVVAAGVPFDGPAPYRPWANYWCRDPVCEPSQYSIGAQNRTRTGGGDFANSSHRWSEGAFPRVLEDGRVLNGGIPQRANLTYHVERLEAGIDGWLPDVDWELHAVIDFEAWTPVWENNDGGSCNWHGKIYQELSLNHTRARFPHITNESVIAALAQEEFENAAIEFFVTTMTVLKKLRPKAQWGFYGFPYAVNGECVTGTRKCGYENPTLGPAWKARNDRLARIWNNVDAFYPSVYLVPQGRTHYDVWELEMSTRTHNAVDEAIRLSRTYSASKAAPVLPFYWPLYHNGSTPVDAHDLRQLIAEAYVPPLSTQLIIWDGGPPMGEKTAGAFRAVDGPVFRAAVEAAEACTASVCSGHGWCDASVAFPGWAPLPAAASNCTCYPGYNGAACAAHSG